MFVLYYVNLKEISLYLYTSDGNLLNSVLLVCEVATKAMVKLVCPRSTSPDLRRSLGMDLLSRNLHSISSTIRPRNDSQ